MILHKKTNTTKPRKRKVYGGKKERTKEEKIEEKSHETK